jgi:N-acetyl-S-(2-succino)cysteine monooxygenase
MTKPTHRARRNRVATMSKDQRKLRLGAFIMATGHHIAAWRHPDSDADAGHNIEHYRGLAQTAERGLFDLVFVADSPAGWDGDRDDEVKARLSHSAHFEPVTLWSALSQVTERIGFVATASTTYEDPISSPASSPRSITSAMAAQPGTW